MAARFAFILLASLLIFQTLSWESHAFITRRDAPDAKASDASQTIDDALQSFKSGLDDLVKNIQGNELLQNVTQSLKSFGEQVEAQGKQLMEKIQNAGQTQ
ncbi:hypothetical protein BDFB_003145 [Asbolus verrucosus]|uniref:Uncharacterized protein n=1 Tax=Asbolus verrucosus TaxID=1661398 RepID=A0A482VC74_ASBVE|nr:hypothetical protein BDFB_003145 [Asbolus verrucosus]